MSNLSVDTIRSEDGNKGPVLDANLDFSQSAYTVLPKGTTAQRPTGVAAGSLRFNTDTKLVEQYNGVDWVTLNSYGVGRGVFGGGAGTPTFVNTIDYITIATTGNASDFGDLSQARFGPNGYSSSTRGVFAGGDTPTQLNTIDYITIATTGNATDFGDLTVTRVYGGSCSSSTRGVFGGGTTPTFVNTIDYITIATTGNATDFGDLTAARNALAACSSSTRGVFGGGNTPTLTNTIDYITIATTGNATDFGDLTGTREFYGNAACSSSTRGVFGGGFTNTPTPTFVNTIDYITIATTGNSQYFGDLFQTRTALTACSSSTRGVFGGGSTYNPAYIPVNTIDFITIASQGTTAQYFGNLTFSGGYRGSLSDAHGGLA
jgi:hypothetical protein